MLYYYKYDKKLWAGKDVWNPMNRNRHMSRLCRGSAASMTWEGKWLEESVGGIEDDEMMESVRDGRRASAVS